MSEVPSIHDCLDAVMQEVTTIRKGSKNEFHKFMFRGVEQVMDHIGPAFRRHHVIPLPELLELTSRDVTTDKGKVQREVTVKVRYRFMGPAKDFYDVVVPGEAQDSGASGVSKAMSVAQRIAYVQALAIPTGEADPEAAGTSRAADPLLDVKRKIAAAAASKGWKIDTEEGMEALSINFEEWSEGVDIASVTDVKKLEDYLRHLQPPRRMRRPQAGAA